jgi:predicted lipoprotein with Yx(FWY)xxD motif
MTKRLYGLALAALFALGLLAGCGSSNDTSSDSSAAASTTKTAASDPVPASGPATINTAQFEIGTVLVNREGKTLYLFEKDTSAESTCSDACAESWPPVTTDGTPLHGDGVIVSMLGMSKRSDGTTQVTYGGRPLYSYSGDSSPGDTRGQEADAFGGEWYAVGANGKKVEGDGAGGE